MPHPFCSPCCSSTGCQFCQGGTAPETLEVTLSGVADKVPTPYTPCDNCDTTNDTYLLTFGSAGETYCEWLYTVDPFSDPLPCFTDLSLRLAQGDVFSFSGDPTHYYLGLQITIGFDLATILFVADLGTDTPDCGVFDAETLDYDSQDSYSGIGEWYCDYTGASAAVSTPTVDPDADSGFDTGFDIGFGV